MDLKTPEVSTVVKDIDASLCTIPEGGDALAILPQTQQVKIQNPSSTSKVSEKNTEHSSASNQTLQCTLLKLSTKLSSSIIARALYSHVNLVKRGILSQRNQVDSLNVECCGFPYYRTSKSCGGLQDVVLVKDAGTSCTLVESGTNRLKGEPRGKPLLERFLVNQLKIECSDLSEITKKISTYTKEILQSLSSKMRTKEKTLTTDLKYSTEEFDERLYAQLPVAMQYMDKTGRPCLKLRMVKSSKYIEPWQQDSKWMNITRRSTEQRNDTLLIQRAEFPQPGNLHYKPSMRPQLYTKEVRQLYPNEPATGELDSSSFSSSSIYDFLMMRNGDKLLQKSTKQFTHPKSQDYSGLNHPVTLDLSNKHRIRKSILTRTDANYPIDSRRNSAKASVYTVRYKISDTKNKSLIGRKTYHSLGISKKEKTIDRQNCRIREMETSDRGCIPMSNLQTVNIHIVRHKRRFI